MHLGVWHFPALSPVLLLGVHRLIVAEELEAVDRHQEPQTAQVFRAVREVVKKSFAPAQHQKTTILFRVVGSFGADIGFWCDMEAFSSDRGRDTCRLSLPLCTCGDLR